MRQKPRRGLKGDQFAKFFGGRAFIFPLQKAWVLAEGSGSLMGQSAFSIVFFLFRLTGSKARQPQKEPNKRTSQNSGGKTRCELCQLTSLASVSIRCSSKKARATAARIQLGKTHAQAASRLVGMCPWRCYLTGRPGYPNVQSRSQHFFQILGSVDHPSQAE